MKNESKRMVVDSFKTRGRVQIIYLFFSICFLIASIVSSAFGFVCVGWKDGIDSAFIIVPIFIVGSILCFAIFLFLIIYLNRYIYFINGDLCVFNGVRKKVFTINQEYTIAFAIAGKTPKQSNEAIFIFKEDKCVIKYALILPEFGYEPYRKKIEDLFSLLSKQTGCLIKIAWDEAIEIEQPDLFK